MQSNANNWSFGKIVAVSVVTGIVVLLFLLLLLGYAFWGAFFWGLVVGAVVFLILWLNFSSDEDEGAGTGAGTGAHTSASTAAATGTSAAAAGASAAATEDEHGVDDDAAAASAVTSPAAETAPVVTEDDPGVEADDAAAALAADSGSVVKPSAALPGQAELASRKGEWKYGGDAADDSGSAAAGDTAATGAAAAPATDDGLGEDYDKDGVREGTDEGAKPEMLTEAREGGADNLKEIKGVGPKMEQMLNGMGVYHFDQVAGWTADEVAWVDANLKGFKGRVSRDGWVDQAKILMTGAETEFSKRVEGGKVY